ncbi:hypothetical protein [Mycobacteroides chelonae]|uniref:hypothetical protein n=1 Tax=Mycobacteroides chelonae TaxID=1774 RepID=UPI003AAA789D
MTLKVELDRLRGLGATLKSLSEEAAVLRTGPSAGPYLLTPGGMEPAVLEAASVAHDLVDSTLVAAIKERLSETGEIMVNVANEYQNADESKMPESTVATIYTNATGNWDVPEVPRP